MVSVESLIDDDALAQTMEMMRVWLDHMRFTPATFRYTFASNGIRLRVEFPAEEEATAFARAFSGRLLEAPSPAAE